MDILPDYTAGRHKTYPGNDLVFADETIRTIELTEKEYMDLKWSIEAWKEQMEEQDLEEFKDFAESEPGTMDDLLHD